MATLLEDGIERMVYNFGPDQAKLLVLGGGSVFGVANPVIALVLLAANRLSLPLDAVGAPCIRDRWQRTGGDASRRSRAPHQGRRLHLLGMITTLASLPAHPKLVPINMLVRVAGTPLHEQPALDPIEFVRTIAVARVTMPRSVG